MSYWIMILLAPLTIRRPLPLITPFDPWPSKVLLEATVIPRIPALSLHSYIIKVRFKQKSGNVKRPTHVESDKLTM